jgi:hypothetical protein
VKAHLAVRRSFERTGGTPSLASRDGNGHSAPQLLRKGDPARPVLQELIEEGRSFSAPETASSEFQRALDEVRQLEAVDIGPAPVIAFLAGYGAASLYYDLTGG